MNRRGEHSSGIENKMKGKAFRRGAIIVSVVIALLGSTFVSLGYNIKDFTVKPKSTSNYFRGLSSTKSFQVTDPKFGGKIQTTKMTRIAPLSGNGYGVEKNTSLYPLRGSAHAYLWSLKGRKANQPAGFKVYDCIIWDESKRRYLKIDVQHKVISWVTSPGYKRAFGPYIAFSKNPSIIARTSGIKKVVIETTYYEAGTTKPISIKSNISVKDVDFYQMMEIYPIIDYITTSDTKLKKHKSSNKFVYPALVDSLNHDPRATFGVIYNTSKLYTVFEDPRATVGYASEKLNYNTLWKPGNGAKYFSTDSSTIIFPKNNKPSIWPFHKITGENDKSKPSVKNIDYYGGEFHIDEDVQIGANIIDLPADVNQKSDLLSIRYEIIKDGVKIHSQKLTDRISSLEEEGIEVYINETINELGVGDYKVNWYAFDNVFGSKEVGPVAMKFEIIAKKKNPETWVEGYVDHLFMWNKNRHDFNKFYSKKAGTPYVESDDKVEVEEYIESDLRPRKRWYNVFWPGEEFSLKAKAGEDVDSIKVTIKNNRGTRSGDGETYYETWLKKDNGGNWTGNLWHESMVDKGGVEEPVVVNFHFTTYYYSEEEKTDVVPIIIDNYRPFWDLDFKVA